MKIDILFVCVAAKMDSSASKRWPSVSSEVGPLVDYLRPLITHTQGITLKRLRRVAKKIKMKRYADARKPVVFALFHFYQRIKLEESATDSSDESKREGTASVTDEPTNDSSDDEVPSIPPSGVVSSKANEESVDKPTSSGAIPLILSGTNVEETSREASEKSERRQTFVVRKRTGRTVSPVRHPTLLPPSVSMCAESEQPACDTREIVPRTLAGTSSRQQSVERSDVPTSATRSKGANDCWTAPDVVGKLIPLERELPRDCSRSPSTGSTRHYYRHDEDPRHVYTPCRKYGGNGRYFHQNRYATTRGRGQSRHRSEPLEDRRRSSSREESESHRRTENQRERMLETVLQILEKLK